jgi:hypothetical protein
MSQLTCPSNTNYFVNIIYYIRLKLGENKGGTFEWIRMPLPQEFIIAALCWTMPLSSAGDRILMVRLVLIIPRMGDSTGEMGDNLNAVDL